MPTDQRANVQAATTGYLEARSESACAELLLSVEQELQEAHNELGRRTVRLAAITADVERSPPFHVIQIDGKGHGVMAARDIERGARILVEKPLIMLPSTKCPGDDSNSTDDAAINSEELEAAVHALSDHDRDAFYALSQSAELYGSRKTALGIVGTNGIPCIHEGTTFGAVFATSSRCNHGCDANASYKWNAHLGSLTIHATRRILAGEEIVYNYLGFLTPREHRRGLLRTEFGFECRCSKCCLEGRGRSASDERIQLIGDEASLRAQLRERSDLEELVRSDPRASLQVLDDWQVRHLVPRADAHAHVCHVDAPRVLPAQERTAHVHDVHPHEPCSYMWVHVHVAHVHPHEPCPPHELPALYTRHPAPACMYVPLPPTPHTAPHTAHSLTHSLTHPLTHPLTHSLMHSLTHSRTHALTHSRTHSLTYLGAHEAREWRWALPPRRDLHAGFRGVLRQCILALGRSCASWPPLCCSTATCWWRHWPRHWPSGRNIPGDNMAARDGRICTCACQRSP